MMKKVMLLLLVTAMLVGFASADGVWEEDMSVDPIPGPWNLRAGSYTMGGDVMTVASGAWACVIDQMPDDPFFGTTSVRMKWRATSGVSNANQGGVGLWCNIGCEQLDPDNPGVIDEDGMYGYMRFYSGMNATGDGQIFGISHGGTVPILAEHAFGTGMLTLDAVIDEPTNTFTYTVTDGTDTYSDTLTYELITVGAATRGWFTLYTRLPAGEFDYIKIANPAGGSSGVAHSPDPTGPLVSSVDVPAYAASGVSWYSPLQDSDGNAITDSNIISVDSYDVWWSVGVEPNYVTDTPTNQIAQSYTPAPAIDYDTTYFWRVDTYITWDTNEITGNFTDKMEGSTWTFTTEPAYTPPAIATFNSVLTTLDIGSGSLSATITDNSDAITSVVWTLLTDDTEFPVGSDAALVDTTTDNQNPTATLTTTYAGTYKVKLVVSDGSGKEGNTQEALAEVDVYADACEAKKDSPGGWTANNYDRDDDCDVDLSDFALLAIEWLDSTELDAPAEYTGVADYVTQAVFDARIEAEWIDPNDPNACSDGPISDTTGIRIETQLNASGEQALGYASATAWVDYTIDVPALAVGNVVDVYAGHALNGTGTVTLSFGTEATPDAYGVGTLDGTSGWTNFTDGRKIGTVTFTAAGPQIVRISFGGGLNLDWFSFDW